MEINISGNGNIFASGEVFLPKEEEGYAFVSGGGDIALNFSKTEFSKAILKRPILKTTIDLSVSNYELEVERQYSFEIVRSKSSLEGL